ncbi:MAG: Nif11-like leader peptide family natural product precursor [Thermodesulfobacteriota bacterium]|nr:Nif11-like leader peptide family natural product precursor [Thermodesulfobacteriota bacterium]
MSTKSALLFMKYINDSDELRILLENCENLDFLKFRDIAHDLGYEFTYCEFQRAYKYYWDLQWHLENSLTNNEPHQ